MWRDHWEQWSVGRLVGTRLGGPDGGAARLDIGQDRAYGRRTERRQRETGMSMKWFRPVCMRGVALAILLVVGSRLPILGTYSHLWEAVRSYAANFRTFSRLQHGPGEGLEYLPRKAIAAVELLHTVRATDFRFAVGTSDTIEFEQRTDEIAWPLPHHSTSRFVVSFTGQATGCIRLGEQEGVSVDRCD